MPEDQRSSRIEKPIDQGGKEENSNPIKDGTQQLLPRKSSMMIESKAIREVDDLVENLDLVDLCQNKSETLGLMEETINEGNISSFSNTTKNKRFSTWKRSIRGNMGKPPDGGARSEACNQKRGTNETEEVGLKKLKETIMDDVTEVNFSQAVVGENQPRRTL